MLERLGETKRLWEVSRKTRISRRFSGHCSLCSIPRFKRSFLCLFLWFFAVSLEALFSFSWLFGVVCHARFAPCSCCCSHVHGRSPMETMRWQAVAMLQKCSSATSSGVLSRNCLGTCLFRNFRRVHSIFTPSLQLNVESCFRHTCEHSFACGNRVIFSPVPLSSSVLKVQLVRHPAPANPAESRALLTRVYHRTRSGSREMFEKIGNAWVRRLKACVAAKGGFFE